MARLRDSHPARMNSKVWIVRVGKAICCGHGLARILHQGRVLRMQECPLPFPEERKPDFVHGGGTDSPGMADVDLLRTVIGQITNPGKLAPPAWNRANGFSR